MLNFDHIKILQTSRVGFEVEFYSNLGRKELAKKLGKYLKKKIKVVFKAHSKIEISRNLFKIEADFSGGSKMHELVTGVMPYEEARIVLSRILRWVAENGWTDERSSLHINCMEICGAENDNLTQI